MRQVRSVVVRIVALALLTAACSNEPSPPDGGSQPGTAADTEAESVFDQLVSEVAEDVVPLDTALEAFALAIGPLPGVQTPEGLRERISSATGPLRWVRGRWDELTLEQQQAVDRYVLSEPADAFGGNGGFIVASATPAGMFAAATADDVDDDALRELVASMRERMSAKLGRPLGIPIELRIAPSFVSGDGAMFAQPIDASGGWSGTPVKCLVTIGKEGMDIAGQITGGVASDELESFIAHELFHCYSFTVGDPSKWPTRPSWVMEGLAEWAGDSMAVRVEDGFWAGWLLTVTIPLFKRTYSALGFWAHLDENGPNLWSTALGIVSASDDGSAAAYDAALATAVPSMLTTWGPGYFRDANHAPAWDQDGPGIPPVKPVPSDSGTVGSGDSRTIAADAMAAAVHVVDLSAEVVTVSPASYGMMQLPDGVELSYPGNGIELLCTKAEGCSCPEDSPAASAIFRQTIEGEARVGLTGSTTGSNLTLSGWNLEDFCQQPPVPDCMIGEWLSQEYRAPGQSVIGGLATMAMTIDRVGRGEIEFNPDVPINARLNDPGAPWVKLVFSGRYSFQVTHNGTTGEVFGGDAYLTHYAFLDGQWIAGTETTPLVPQSGTIGSTFLCDGDNLIVRAPGAVSEFELSRIEG